MDLTLISQNEYDNIANTSMTADEAFQYMSKSIRPRTFEEILTDFGRDRNVKTVLVNALCEYSPEVSRESISKKVRGWLSGKYEPSDRETLMQICFALGLSERRADDFLSCCTDSGFHYRDPRELAYSFALRIGMDYREAVELYQSLSPLPPGKEDTAVYTETLYNEFYKINTKQEFISFYENNIDKLGTLHNTAYMYFRSFIGCLRDPDGQREYLFEDRESISKRLSIEVITGEYLRMNVPMDAAGNTYLQRMIKKYWPCATSVKNMYSRREDVTRKVLILLYVITEGIAPDVNYDFVFDDELTPNQLFEEHYDKLCVMLTDCGMSLPDPRNVFDWAVLHALRKDNYEEMNEELREVLNRVFSE